MPSTPKTHPSLRTPSPAVTGGDASAPSRRLRALALLAPVLLAGCQLSTERAVEPVQARPIVVDEAMQRRDWAPVVATYQSGAVVAGPTGFLFEPTTAPEGRAIEIPLFLVNVAALPGALFVTPPWTPVLYRGVVTEPSYTMAEPYPEDIQAAREQQRSRSRTSSANPADAEDAASRSGTVSGQVPTNAQGTGAGALSPTGSPAAPNPAAGTAAQGTAVTGSGTNAGTGTPTGANVGTGAGTGTGSAGGTSGGK